MPLTQKGKKVMAAMMKTYGDKAKAEEVFYASIKSGKLTGCEQGVPANRPKKRKQGR